MSEQPKIRKPVRIFAVVSLLLAVGLTLIPSTKQENPGPWPIAVDGRDTGVVAVAALDPSLNGPVITWVSRAATKADLPIGFPPTDQQRSRNDAWRGTLYVLRKAAPRVFTPRNGPIPQPDLNSPDAWFGRSTGLAYALAYTDSEPLNPTPGSLLNGRTIAATGFVDPTGTLIPVEYIPAKYAAAKEAGVDLFFIPRNSYRIAKSQGFPVDTLTDPPVIPVASLLETIRILCGTGGTGLPCEATLSSPSTWWKRATR